MIRHPFPMPQPFDRLTPCPKPTPTRDRRDKKRAKEQAWQRVRQCVLVRDDRRCRVCRSREDVDVHHLRFRSTGGADSTSNCAALCRSCHADVHGYRLAIHGDANQKLRIERL